MLPVSRAYDAYVSPNFHVQSHVKSWHFSPLDEDAKEFVGGGAGLKCTFTVAPTAGRGGLESARFMIYYDIYYDVIMIYLIYDIL